MKDYILSFCCLAAILTPLEGLSQNPLISLGGEIGLPDSYGLNMVAGTLTGGSLRFESSFGKHIAGLATVGYLFSSRQNPYPTTPTTTSTYNVCPVQVGIKYYTKQKDVVQKGLFFSVETGFLLTTTRFTYASNPPSKRKETDLAFAPGIGYLLGPVEPSFRLQYDLTDAGFNVYYFNFRLAYAFIKNNKER